jgi:hypothetical protein
VLTSLMKFNDENSPVCLTGVLTSTASHCYFKFSKLKHSETKPSSNALLAWSHFYHAQDFMPEDF